MSSFSFLSHLYLLSITAVCLLQLPTSTTAASYYDQYQQSQQSSSSAYDVFSSRRERNLDHWDADTAAAYMGLTRTKGGDAFAPVPPQNDVYAGHDAAILFYAQWCQNCHALAPNYDAIGTLMEAGTTKSNLILALFDCERDADHMALCRAVGIQAYPTLMFVGSGPYHDRDPFTAKLAPLAGKSANKPGTVPTELKRVVQFAGDWRYAEQVMDWIKCMRGLSRWHRLNTEGWLSVLRRGIFGLLRKPDITNSKAKTVANSLPVGVPPRLVEARNAASGGGGMMSTAETAALQKQVTTLETQMKSYNDLLKTSNEAVLHASYTVDSFLMPTTPREGELGADCVVETSHPPYVDVYAALKNSDGWDATADSGKAAHNDDGDASADGADTATSGLSDEYLLRSCVVDLSLDYCTRVSSRVTTDYLDELETIPEADYPKLSDLDALLNNRTDAVEPYCSTFTECYVEEFQDEAKCRADACPFKNEVACRYVANCLDARIKKEYTEALTAIGETAEQRAAAAASDKKSTSGSKAWGVA